MRRESGQLRDKFKITANNILLSSSPARTEINVSFLIELVN